MHRFVAMWQALWIGCGGTEICALEAGGRCSEWEWRAMFCKFHFKSSQQMSSFQSWHIVRVCKRLSYDIMCAHVAERINVIVYSRSHGQTESMGATNLEPPLGESHVRHLRSFDGLSAFSVSYIYLQKWFKSYTYVCTWEYSTRTKMSLHCMRRFKTTCAQLYLYKWTSYDLIFTEGLASDLGCMSRRWATFRCKFVEIPELVVQSSCKEHPGEVGFEQIGGHFIDGLEGDDGGDDRNVEDQYVVQCCAEALTTEEEHWPCEVERELHGIQSERESLLRKATFGPDEPGCEAHERVEDAPCPSEEEARWLPSRLRQVEVPLCIRTVEERVRHAEHERKRHGQI